MERTFEVDISVLCETLDAVGADEVDSFVDHVVADMGGLIGHLDVCGINALDAVAREAHHLSGGCRAMGLVGIGEVCARIEADAHDGLRDKFPAYSIELAQQRQALRDWWSTASADPRLSGFWPLA